jgi:RNA polymerase sigma factor (sigma-70 family)
MNNDRIKYYFEKYKYRLTFFAVSLLGSNTYAHDVVSGVFIELGKLDEISEDKGGSVSQWLYKRVRWECAKMSKRRSMMNRHHAIIAHGAEESYMIKADLQGSVIDELHDAIDKLPVAQRMVFKMRYIEWLKPREICKALNIRPGTFDNHIMKAKHRLREQFRGREIY